MNEDDDGVLPLPSLMEAWRPPTGGKRSLRGGTLRIGSGGIRLVGALMLEQNDEWSVSRRYMTLETIGALSDKPRISLPALAA
jgi:hypothetical protein